MNKEHSLLMKGPMVLALLAELKTQTRRIVKNVDAEEFPYVGTFDEKEGVPFIIFRDALGDGVIDRIEAKFPYGPLLGVIWIRETWASAPTRNNIRPSLLVPGEFVEYAATYPNKSHFVWRPSIFMPRWASRINRRLKALRVEHLQDISSGDAIAEGIERIPQLGILRASGWRDYSGKSAGFMDPVDSYRSLWNFINLKPKPVYERRAEKMIIVSYESYPWNMSDFNLAYPGAALAESFQGKPLAVYPNAWVWVLELEKI